MDSLIGKIVVINTQDRWIWSGKLLKATQQANGCFTVEMEDCRGCIWYTKEIGGFGGLAAKGPDKTCRIGPKVKRHIIVNVTLCQEITDCGERVLFHDQMIQVRNFLLKHGRQIFKPEPITRDKLIEAGPDLLAACKYVVDQATNKLVIDEIHNNYQVTLDEREYTAIEKAIKRAGG